MALNPNNVPQHGGAEAFGEHLRMLQNVIGPIPTTYKYDHPYQQSRAYGDLTELLIQRAPRVVEEQIKGLLIEGYHSELLHNILPIRVFQPGESLRIEWSELKFDSGLAPAVAVEGIAPVYTHNKTKHSTRAVRRAAGIRIESTFFQTEEGQREWRLKIQQLASIIQRTNEYDAMITLLQAPFRGRLGTEEMNGPYNVYGLESDSVSFMERLKMEVDMFGIVNLTADSRGFANLCTSVRTAMKRHHVEPDYMIAPPLMVGFYFGDKDDLWHYSSAGPQALQNRANAADIGGNSPIRRQSIQGMKVVDMHLYRPTNDSNTDEANDLLTVKKQIGEFYCAEVNQVYTDLGDFDSYRGSHRDIRIFNEKHGVLVPVRYADMLKNCLRWGFGAEDPMELSQDAHEGKTADMFWGYDDRVASSWYKVRDQFLSAGTLERVARTLAKLGGNTDTIEKLTAAIESIEGMLTRNDPIRTEAGVTITFAGGQQAYEQARNALCVRYGTMIFRVVNKLLGTIVVDDRNNYLVQNGLPQDANQVCAFIERLTNRSIDVFGVDPNVNAHIQGLFDKLDALPWLHRLLAAIWLLTPINLPTLLQQHDKDIFIPIDFILARPYMTYNVSSAIILKGGKELGETVIGHTNFQATSNVMDRMIYGSMVYYGKSYVRKKENVTVTPSVFIQSYCKGNDTTFITRDDIEEITENAGLFESNNSILALAVPVSENASRHTVMDIRGKHEQLKNEVDQGSRGGENAPFYSTYQYYKGLLDIEGTDLASPADPYVDYETMDFRANSIVFRGHYEYGPGFKKVSTNCGHLGMYVYDGVHYSRTPGRYTPVKQVTYNSHMI